jgi:hypothetical protein
MNRRVQLGNLDACHRGILAAIENESFVVMQGLFRHFRYCPIVLCPNAN